MKKSWWKIPLYCIVASWISFQLQIRFLVRLTLVTLPDGAITADNTRMLFLSGITFLVIILLGGFLFCRKMTRRELFWSATVLAALNVTFGLLSNLIPGTASVFIAEFTNWSSFLSSLLFQLTDNLWLSAIICWLFPPYLFVVFGKRYAHE